MPYRIVAALSLVLLHSMSVAAPRLFDVPLASVTPALLAEAANHYVALGETEAMKELGGLARSSSPLARGFFDGNDIRIGWLCRILFEQGRGSPSSRPPGFGGLTDFPERNMRPDHWPLFPLARSGTSHFVLGHSYLIGGLPEFASQYLDYSRQHGTFRQRPLPVPTREQAIKDALALRASTEWQSLRWKDSGEGWSYTLSETGAWHAVLDQAIAIEEQPHAPATRRP